LKTDFILSCCSTADLTAEHFAARDIVWVPFHFFLNEEEYPDNLGRSVSFPDFYQAMREGAATRTAQVNVEEYIDHFTPFLETGKDILHVCLSSGISGTFNSALIAREALRDKYPDRKLYIVDSLTASAGVGLIMDRLADLRDEGTGIDEIYEWVEANKLKCEAWFFTSDLTYLIRGGRVSKASGAVGSLLGICPLMTVSGEGKLLAREKIRSKKKVMQAAVQKMAELAANGADYNGKCFLSNADCMEDARAMADLIEAAFPNLNGRVKISTIGTTIGSHTGPGTVAIFFWGRENRT